MQRLAAIFGCAGASLTADEAAFFRETRPWGFILFRRNVESPDQLRALTSALRETVDDPAAPILVDQEGGRVQRLGPPHWPKYPPGRAYGELPKSVRADVTRLGGELIARDLAAVGIDVDCAPVLDVPEPGAHDVIGDRAYGQGPALIAQLGRAFAEGLMAGGVLPVVKHIPGHGRARADSHAELPVVTASLPELQRDFAPFRACADLPMAMTSHVVYAAIDPSAPATQSAAVVSRIIRAEIGFDGLLLTDDLSMKALSGGFDERARRAHDAGCDVILHCNGDMAEMGGVAHGARPLSGDALRRAEAALAGRQAPEAVDTRQARERFDAAFAGIWSP